MSSSGEVDVPRGTLSSAKSDPSINPAQTFLYLLSNRVGSPIRYGSVVRRESTRIRGDLAKWLSHACYGRRINANWARSAWIKIRYRDRRETRDAAHTVSATKGHARPSTSTKRFKKFRGEISGALMTWPLQQRPCAVTVER